MLHISQQTFWLVIAAKSTAVTNHINTGHDSDPACTAQYHSLLLHIKASSMRKARCTQAWRTQKQKDLIHLYADQYLDLSPVENYEIKNMVILQK